jgi:hypothetical protein
MLGWHACKCMGLWHGIAVMTAIIDVVEQHQCTWRTGETHSPMKNPPPIAHSKLSHPAVSMVSMMCSPRLNFLSVSVCRPRLNSLSDCDFSFDASTELSMGQINHTIPIPLQCQDGDWKHCSYKCRTARPPTYAAVHVGW